MNTRLVLLITGFAAVLLASPGSQSNGWNRVTSESASKLSVPYQGRPAPRGATQTPAAAYTNGCPSCIASVAWGFVTPRKES